MNAAASHSTIYKAVLNGSMKSILDEVKAGLAQGMEPGMIVSDELIPATADCQCGNHEESH